MIDGRPIRTPLSSSAKHRGITSSTLKVCLRLEYMPSRMIEYSEMLECKLTQELIPTLPTEKHRFELVPETYFAQVNCKFDLKMATTR